MSAASGEIGAQAMRIVLIDDNDGSLGAMAMLMRHLGHQVREFVDPLQALAAISLDTDLVVSDVNMPAMDGFAVAEEVLAILGNHLPKVLLFSGGDHKTKLEVYPPSAIIGIMPKPIRLANLSHILTLLERARTQCPGTLGTFYPCVQTSPENTDVGAESVNKCFSSAYADCPHYNAGCGKGLRFSVGVAASYGVEEEGAACGA